MLWLIESLFTWCSQRHQKFKISKQFVLDYNASNIDVGAKKISQTVKEIDDKYPLPLTVHTYAQQRCGNTATLLTAYKSSCPIATNAPAVNFDVSSHT